MTFIWPIALISLFSVPLLIAAYVLLQRRRRRIVAQYGSLGFLQSTTGRSVGLRRHLPSIVLLAGLSILMIASARPQTKVTLPRIEGTVILAFDVSGSMAADDMQPTRMEAAKAAAREFVQQQPPSVQIGIVAFSDSGFSVQPPTNDKDAVLASINRLTPQRGTAVANGILVSLKAIETNEQQALHFYTNLTPEPATTPTPVPHGQFDSAAIVLLTDGENNELPDPMTAAQAAADRGVRIYTVGLGSPTGTTLHVNGFTVHTKLDEAALQQIAQTTGGTYYNATTAQDLSKIYSTLDTKLVVKPETIEVTSIFAGASAAILLLGGLLSLLWFSRLP
jgi:Ca-activated chloride channel family protein